MATEMRVFPCTYSTPGWVLGAVTRAPVILPLQSLASNPRDPKILQCKPIKNGRSIQVEERLENLPDKGQNISKNIKV